jgi:hypothetical protein
MAQSNPKIAFGAEIGKAAHALVRSCSPRARVVRKRLEEIAASGPSVCAISAIWADVRQADPASSSWALAA